MQCNVIFGDVTRCNVVCTKVAPGLTSNGRPEEDEGQAQGAVLLLDLPPEHHEQQHVGKHMLEAGVNQNAGHPPAGGWGSHRG